jgi:hypothetical protein
MTRTEYQDVAEAAAPMEVDLAPCRVVRRRIAIDLRALQRRELLLALEASRARSEVAS